MFIYAYFNQDKNKAYNSFSLRFLLLKGFIALRVNIMHTSLSKKGRGGGGGNYQVPFLIQSVHTALHMIYVYVAYPASQCAYLHVRTVKPAVESFSGGNCKGVAKLKLSLDAPSSPRTHEGRHASETHVPSRTDPLGSSDGSLQLSRKKPTCT